MQFDQLHRINFQRAVRRSLHRPRRLTKRHALSRRRHRSQPTQPSPKKTPPPELGRTHNIIDSAKEPCPIGFLRSISPPLAKPSSYALAASQSPLRISRRIWYLLWTRSNRTIEPH